MKTYFLSKHLKESNLTYIEHMFRALRFSTMIFTALMSSIAHAFIPFLFEKCVTDLYNKLEQEELN
tara:strand:+ start:338 stop:535 length:198 start_codon:yes stop_codon:yes gene_type:complete